MTTHTHPPYDEDLFQDTTMTFGEHLAELRQCLLRALFGLVLMFVVVLVVDLPSRIISFINRPLQGVLTDFYLLRAQQWLGDQLAEVERLGYPVPPRETMLDTIQQDRLIPELYFLDVDRAVQYLAQLHPERFSAAAAGPLSRQDLLDPAGLCRLMWQERQEGSAAVQKLWQRLPPRARQVVQQVAEAGTGSLSDEQLRVLVEAFSQLVQSDSPLLSEQDFQPFLGMQLQVAVTPAQRLALQRRERFLQLQQLAENGSRPPLPVWNRLVLAALFPEMIASGPRKQNMVPVVLWRSLEEDPRVSIKSLGPYETFMIWLKAAIVASLVIASPWVFYQLWIFVAAGLYPHEKRYVYVFLPISLGLFLGGVVLCFVYVLPIVLDFLFVFNRWTGVDPDMRISDWFGFALMLPLMFGVSFQLPLVMLFLERIGVFTVEAYLSQWRVAILVIMVLSMLLTPMDPGSMLMMAIPLIALYFGGVALCRYMPRSSNPYGQAPEE